MRRVNYIYKNPLEHLKPEEPIRYELDRLYEAQDRRKPLIRLTPDELCGDVLKGLSVRPDGTVFGTNEIYDSGIDWQEPGLEEINYATEDEPPEDSLWGQVEVVILQALACAAAAIVDKQNTQQEAEVTTGKYAGIGTGPD